MLEDVRARIRSGFYIDQLQMQEGPQKTAEEVMQRTEDKLRLMGPVLGRQHHEFLKPVITRLFDIMNRQNLLPPAPKKIQGKDFDVRYSSMIARAQRMGEGQNIARALGMLQPLAQQDPSMLDILDKTKLSRFVWEINGNPHNLLLSDIDLKKLKDARAKAAQTAVQQQEQQHQADVVNKVAPAVAAANQGPPSNVPQP